MQVSGDYTDSRSVNILCASVSLWFILQLTASNNYSEKMTHANHSDHGMINLLKELENIPVQLQVFVRVSLASSRD